MRDIILIQFRCLFPKNFIQLIKHLTFTLLYKCDCSLLIIKILFDNISTNKYFVNN